MQSHRPQQFLNLFEFLVDDAQLIDTSGQLMERYNLLPNDALILSTCKYHAIQHVAGYDITDFESVCKEENMILISSILELKTVFV